MATSLLRSLPAARAAVEEDDGPDAMFGIAASMGGGAGPQRPSFQVPPYGARQSFVPRKAEHFGDGGAFPECAMAQYPLGLGKDDASGTLAPPSPPDLSRAVAAAVAAAEFP